MDNRMDKRTVTQQTRTADYGNVDNDRLKPIVRYRLTTKVGFRALSLQWIQISPPKKN